jgi:hypothetical protein
VSYQRGRCYERLPARAFRNNVFLEVETVVGGDSQNIIGFSGGRKDMEFWQLFVRGGAGASQMICVAE